MKLITNNIKGLMIVFGIITCSMSIAVVAPGFAMQAFYHQTISGPFMELLVRSWGFLVFLMGIMYLYGAFTPKIRNFALAVVSFSKVAFVTLLFSYGLVEEGLSSVFFDSLMGLTGIAYLVSINLSGQPE